MKKSIIVGLHLGFWLCYILITMTLLGLYWESKEQTGGSFQYALIRVFFFAVIPSVLSFYVFYFRVFPYVREKKIVLSTLYAVLISVGVAMTSAGLMCIVLGVESLTRMEEPAMVGIAFISFVNLVLGVVALVTKGFISWFAELKLKEELQQKNHEMEMALVKSQLDPHFLFNTLNNIDILILKDASEASNYLNKLSDIMRFMLFEAKAERILLRKEIEYIEKYIALQKIRTANSNYINFKVTGTVGGQMIAPMVFLPFIENAFKHTTNKKLDNAINIHIQIVDGVVKLDCINKFNPHRKLKQGNNGLGNELIEKRLKLIYPDQHTLKVIKEQEEYNVSLTIYQTAN